MKKTALFGLAVMATATLLAVESKNVVGYTTLSLNKGGFTGGGNSFVTVAGTGLKVSAIKPKGYFDFLNADDMADFTAINFQVIDKDGRGVKSYTWEHDFDWNEMGYVDGAGFWYDGFNNEVVVANGDYDWTIPAGQGLLFDAPELEKDGETANITMENAGEVYTATVPVALNKGGFTLVANPFPKGIKVSSLVPTGYFDYLNADDMADFTAINFQVIDKDGRGVKSYTWEHDFDWNEMGYVDGAGFWYDGFNNEVVVANGDYDWTVPAGQGLLWDAPELEKDGETANISFSFYYPES